MPALVASPMVPSVDHHRFNDDLLLEESDRRLASKIYPSVIHVLDHPELRQLFCQYELPAQRAKRTGLLAGLAAIVFGFGSLAIATAEFLIASPHQPLPVDRAQDRVSITLAIIAGLCGLLGFTIGSIGVLFARRKRHWLYCRLMAERIRQIHFQMLIFRLPQILSSLKDDAGKSAFLSERKLWFDSFRTRFADKLDSAFASIIHEEGEIDPWFFHNTIKTKVHDTKELEPIFEAYRELRIVQQLSFANYKLQDDHRFISTMPRRQLAILSQALFTCVTLLVLMHLGVLAGVVFPASTFSVFHSSNAVVVIIWIALAALAFRAVEQGLQPAREVERYQQYRSGVRAILERYDQAPSQAAKIAIMYEMERLSFDEMRTFLINVEQSSFVL